MTLEESREIIPLMESMIGQIEEQQTLMAEMLLDCLLYTSIYKMKANYKCSNISRRLKASQDSPISVYGDLYEWDNNNSVSYTHLVMN